MTSRAPTSVAPHVGLPPAMAGAIRAGLPTIAEQTVVAIVADVPEYAAALTGELRTNIEQAVPMALSAFVRLAEDARHADPGTPHQQAITASYELGRGEARAGRTVDALLAAYRIGARVAWRGFSDVAVDQGLEAPALARFAGLTFAYIDELSAASVAGHADERATTGRVRERYLERLAQLLVEGASTDVLQDATERASWEPPATLTAVVLPSVRLRRARSRLDQQALALTGGLVGGPLGADDVVLLVPDAGGGRRSRLLASLEGCQAVVGPTRSWAEVAGSFRRALRARATLAPDAVHARDTEEHLAELVTTADPAALADLRERALAPLAELRPAVQARLALTLRSWLLHQGRRDAVAAELFVHPQTVRYRMTQVRELYGEQLDDPRRVHELVVALGAHGFSVPPDASGSVGSADRER